MKPNNHVMSDEQRQQSGNEEFLTATLKNIERSTKSLNNTVQWVVCGPLILVLLGLGFWFVLSYVVN